MWGLMWGYVGGGCQGDKTIPGMQGNAGLAGRAKWAPARATFSPGYSKSSSAARLTAARRLLTLSLL